MLRTLVAALALALAASIPAAAAAPTVSLALRTQVVGNDAEAIKPGTVLRYTIVATNKGSVSANALTPIGPVPARTQFVEASPAGNAGVEYTLDNKSWSARPMVPKTVDGVVHMVPAPTSSYLGVRWKMHSPLAPHATASFVYEVRVK